MKLHNKCLLCNSTELNILKKYEKTYLNKCKACGFIFSNRIPTEDELIKHYEGYGRSDYLSSITIKRYHELLDEFEKYRKTNRIIDVGCGVGYFLEVAKSRGWEVHGTEFTDKAINICEEKGIKMKQGVLEPSDYPSGFFDIVTSFEVLEHINNPQQELNSFNEIIRKGGLVYFTTPNFNSLLRYRLKENYDVITYPEHLSYYTPKTINKLFLENGFSNLKLLTTGISFTRLKRGKASIIKSTQIKEELISANSTDEKLRSDIENKKHLQIAKKIINSTLTFFGVGDSLKGYYIKK